MEQGPRWCHENAMENNASSPRAVALKQTGDESLREGMWQLIVSDELEGLSRGNRQRKGVKNGRQCHNW